MEPEEKHKMSNSESGRLGGKSTMAKHGSDHYARLGEKGGATTARRHGKEHFSRIGKLHAVPKDAEAE